MWLNIKSQRVSFQQSGSNDGKRTHLLKKKKHLKNPIGNMIHPQNRPHRAQNGQADCRWSINGSQTSSGTHTSSAEMIIETSSRRNAELAGKQKAKQASRLRPQEVHLKQPVRTERTIKIQTALDPDPSQWAVVASREHFLRCECQSRNVPAGVPDMTQGPS